MKTGTDAPRRPRSKPKKPAKRRKKTKTAVRTNDYMFCPRCGGELQPWQKYCADCGANLHRHFVKDAPDYFYDETETVPDAETLSAAGSSDNGKNAVPTGAAANAAERSPQPSELLKRGISAIERVKNLRPLTRIDWAVFGEALAILLLTATIAAVSVSQAVFGGSYSLITDAAAQIYTFDDAGGYVYTDAEGKLLNGTYLRNRNKITLTDAEGHKSELIHKGDCLCPETARYDNKYVRSEREQTLTRIISLMYDGGTLRTTRTLELHKDHTCRIEVVTTFIGDELEDPIVREGTYRRWGSRLILKWNDGFTEVEQLINGYLYYNIYQKQ